MTRKNPNISYYHYRSETKNEDGTIKIKYYLTLKDVCNEFNTSTYTLYKIINNGYKPKNKKLQNVVIKSEYMPTTKIIKNNNEYNI